MTKKLLILLTLRLPPEAFFRGMKTLFFHPILGTVRNKRHCLRSNEIPLLKDELQWCRIKLNMMRKCLMLSNEKMYEKLNKDPISSCKRKLVTILTRLKYEGKLKHDLYSHFYPTCETLLSFQNAQKDVPFRPIVDYTGSISYNTSWFLADILAPLIGTRKPS